MAFRFQNPLELEERIDHPDCIFCRIVRGELPAYKVFEDQEFLGFLDIRPLNKGHVLLVPKKHYRWTYDVPNFGDYFETAKRIIQSQISSLGASSVSIITLGHEVPHAHIQLIPRYPDDGHGGNIKWGSVQQFSEGQMKETADEIREGLGASKITSKSESLTKMMEQIQKDMKEISETFGR